MNDYECKVVAAARAYRNANNIRNNAAGVKGKSLRTLSLEEALSRSYLCLAATQDEPDPPPSTPDLAAIAARNEERRAIKDKATPGPWYDHNPDDPFCMNAYCVSISSIEPNAFDLAPPTGDSSSSDIIAFTLLQTPRIAGIRDYKWAENATFIAFARNDTAEDDIDVLLARISSLEETIATMNEALLNAKE